MSDYVGEKVEINLPKLYGGLFGYVGAPFPTLNPVTGFIHPFAAPVQYINAAASLLASPGGFKEIMHVSIYQPDLMKTPFKFPYQPIISVKTSNKIIRRFPSTSGSLRGSIKERWSEEDAVITLKGVFMDPPVRTSSFLNPPEAADDFSDDLIEGIELLSNLKQHRGSVQIINRFTELLGIDFIAIEDVEFEAYSSLKVRPFVIKGYSDFPQYNLLEE